ncbi:hypothetical protein HX017_14225 [Myroides marinus]|uniref:hypothetical protein n=1 Tax=Myroides TaxID=76831 RepID=UPI002578CD00|nr:MULTISPECIES: hypothetical protein [Myroides]MDM1346432.1 hypothetical protein [Myroides marinus]MDM1349850.1 hypothetical protein [Myroides marinus]MDM1357058.1 hypothetical protein [Myroides marinus]MDM1361802.1 hypothetical protein [Myroides marinus]MDM1366104.1 hypothetical protein [Myroides marinus]
MSKKKEQVKDFDLGYKVSRINTTKFSYNDLEEDFIKNLFENEENLKLLLDVNIGISLEKSEIFFEINTSLSNKNTNENLILHTGKTTFSLQNLSSTFSKENEKFDLPDGLIVQLYALSYSHARALLSIELNRTAYKDIFYLPVIDPTTILNK